MTLNLSFDENAWFGTNKPWDQPKPITYFHYAAVEPSADLTARLFQERGREDDWEVAAVSDYIDLPEICHHAYHAVSEQLEREHYGKRAVVISSLYCQDKKDHIYITPELSKSSRFEEVIKGIAKELNISIGEEVALTNGRSWYCALFIGRDEDDPEELWMRYRPRFRFHPSDVKDTLQL